MTRLATEEIIEGASSDGAISSMAENLGDAVLTYGLYGVKKGELWVLP